jgi:hypothetical protein
MLNYNFSHKCIYYDLHKICESDIACKKQNGVSNNELFENTAFVNTAYQIDLLTIFCVPDTGSNTDIDNVSSKLDALYLHLQSNKACQDLMLLAASKLDSVDPKIGLSILYSFHYMYFMHDIVSTFEKVEQNQTKMNEVGTFEQVELLKKMLRES